MSRDITFVTPAGFEPALPPQEALIAACVPVSGSTNYAPARATTAALAGKVDKSSVVNVRDYGVALDGSATTGAALANAISAASILGLPLRLPAGTYKFDQVN